ncbi:MAG TPA: FAD-dependent oxidoreductase, partial [Chryseosolibacter sp.]|nr:FAD-dependent oxidoreductase [Chryseosolibacter sp.]
WVADPFAGGAYAFATVETPNARALLTRPVQDTLYFAGEALYSGPAMGTVEAALVSGREVAARM